MSVTTETERIREQLRQEKLEQAVWASQVNRTFTTTPISDVDISVMSSKFAKTVSGTFGGDAPPPERRPREPFTVPVKKRPTVLGFRSNILGR